MDEDKRSAYDTLYRVLVTTAQLLAPFTPFVSEVLYRSLTGAESVHLCRWPELPERLQDHELVSRLSNARLIVRLALSLRQRAGVRVRQPLRLLQVAVPRAVDVANLEALEAVLRDEVNVKAVAFVRDAEELGRLRVVPDARKIGPVYGKETQRIIAAGKRGQARVEDDTIEIWDGRDTWRISRNDVTVGYTADGTTDVAADRGFVVALDTEVTEELRREGEFNDMNRRVQKLRKDAGLAVTDRILLEIDGAVPEEWSHRLARSALAEPATVSEPDAEATLRIDGEAVTVRIARVPTQKPERVPNAGNVTGGRSGEKLL
jgi:isoleucyl-tRNA synthetase